MALTDRAKAISVLAASTGAFTVCFAVWMMYGVLMTYLVDRGVYAFSTTQMGWLIGVPVLSGSLLRLPAGLLADRLGGRRIMVAIMVAAAAATYGASLADGFWGFLIAGLGFGTAGASFAAGVAYISVWFSPERQGSVLGVFGMGNLGAALTAAMAPRLLDFLTRSDSLTEQWRLFPRLYAAILLATALLFWIATHPRRASPTASLRQRLAPLGSIRVWRFGLYYFLLFGGFVALSQWLIPYYVNVYGLTMVTAGTLASVFSLPSGLFRALGGWLSDRLGARAVMYWSLGLLVAVLVLLYPPRLELRAPGQGVLATRPGVVTSVSEHEVVVGDDRYPLQRSSPGEAELRVGIHHTDERHLLLPTVSVEHAPAIQVGDRVATGQLLIRGTTRIYFQANRWIFAVLVVVLGVLMGLGSGAVFKHIADYFPGRVGAVGGLVSMLGALGGFVYPILFGYLLDATGIWTTCWMLLTIVAMLCLVWMHLVIRRLVSTTSPALLRQVENPRES